MQDNRIDLNETLVFAAVVKAGSFVAASRELAMPKSTVSRKVSELEQRLGARLLERTTRQLRLTEIGHVYYQHAERVLSEVEAAELAVARLQEVPRGLLRVTTPINTPYLGSVLASFLELHPEVQLDVVCTDRVMNLVQDGFDVAIRAGRLLDSSLVARSLGSMRNLVVASPRFVDGSFAPAEPEDLSRFACLRFGASPDPSLWTLRRAGRAVDVRVGGALVVNDFDLLRQAAAAGVGIAFLPAHLCADELSDGRLVRLLPQWCSPAVPLHAVYPSARQLSPKVRAFVEHLASALSTLPWERPER